MFEIYYRIVHSEYDDFIGQNGFLCFKCNKYIYGEMYPKELEGIMDTVSLYDWFERLTRVIKYLNTKPYVVLSDVESYNTWIEFKKTSEYVIVSILKAIKEQGSRDIEFELLNPVLGEWANQKLNFNQMKNEIIAKAKEYIEYLVRNNVNNTEINKIKEEIEINISVSIGDL